MPNENLKRMLNLSKKMEEQTNSSATKRTINTPRTIMTEQQLDKQIDIWDDQVFGKSEPVKGYDPMADVENIKNRRNEGIVTNNPILQEVLNNPYDFDIDVITGAADPRRQKFDNELKEKYKGIDNAVKINETIEKKDKEKIEEKKRQVSSNVMLDYEQLKEIIEEVIDNKLNDIKKVVLNENRTNYPSGLSMMLLNNNGFTFVDSEGNMYECTGIKRKGKARISQ